MFALNGSASYHLNLLVQQLGVKATGNWACPFTWVAGGPQIACNSSVTNTMTAIAKFGGAGGNHGTGGYTGTNVVAMTGPTNPQTVSAWEQAGRCDPFDAPGAPECSPQLGGGVTNSQLGLLQTPAVAGFVPDWIVPPIAPAPGESLYWWPLNSDPVLYQGSDPDYGASGRWTVITLTKNINYNPAFEQSPSASWPPMAAPPIPSGSITRIYGVTRGSFDGIGGISYLGQGPYPGGSINFVGNFSAWSGVAYSSLAPSSYFDPQSFPWTAYNPVMSIPDSVYWSGTSTFTTSNIGFLLYVVKLQVCNFSIAPANILANNCTGASQNSNNFNTTITPAGNYCLADQVKSTCSETSTGNIDFVVGSPKCVYNLGNPSATVTYFAGPALPNGNAGTISMTFNLLFKVNGKTVSQTDNATVECPK